MYSVSNKEVKRYFFSDGESVFDTCRKLKGTIKYLRNDSHEQYKRKYDPTHFYYHIDYEDGSFDTYVSGMNLVPFYSLVVNSGSSSYSNSNSNSDSSTNTDSTKKNNFDPEKLISGQRFFSKMYNKYGTIIRLRNDYYEQTQRLSDPTHYYYHVNWDDGTFETYIHGKYLEPI